MINYWIDYVKNVQNKNNINYKQALQLAKHSYKGGSLKSDYIKHIIYKYHFNPFKIKNPSEFILEGKHLDKRDNEYNENENVIKYRKKVLDYNEKILKAVAKQQENNYLNRNNIIFSEVFTSINEFNNFLNSGRKTILKNDVESDKFNRLITAIVAYDYYPTPKVYADKIFKDVCKWYGNYTKNIIVLDIACGLLSLSEKFIINNIKTYLIEMNKYFYSFIKPLEKLNNVDIKNDDFFDLPNEYYFKKDINVIVMNPPFSGKIDNEMSDKIYLYFIMKAVDILLNSKINKHKYVSRFLYVICPKTYFKNVNENELTVLNIPNTIVKKACKYFNIDYWSDYTPHITFMCDVIGFKTLKKGKPIVIGSKFGLYKFEVI
jgi:hypothetical protein